MGVQSRRGTPPPQYKSVRVNETNRLLTEARDALVHAGKMASVGRHGAGVAHEVGNPLGAIPGYLSLPGLAVCARLVEEMAASFTQTTLLQAVPCSVCCCRPSWPTPR
jgi:C4-dicarboxylate-specific signal transduction histidine kinase